MENDPEWKRIQQLGRIAKEESQAVTQMAFMIPIALFFLSIFVTAMVPEDWKNLVSGVGILTVIISVIVAGIGCVIFNQRAFAERDKDMDEYFKKRNESRNSTE